MSPPHCGTQPIAPYESEYVKVSWQYDIINVHIDVSCTQYKYIDVWAQYKYIDASCAQYTYIDVSMHNICTASHKKKVIVDQHSVPPWRDSSDLFHYFISQRKAVKWPEHFYEVFQVWRFKAPVAFLKFKILTSTTGGTQSKLETIESLRYQFMSNIFIGMKLLVLAIAPPESQSDSCPW